MEQNQQDRPEFAIGAAGLLASEFAASALYFWGPWKEITMSWVLAWAKAFP